MIKYLLIPGLLTTLGTAATAGCDNFEDGSLPNTSAPKYRICYDDVCDETQLSYQCANAYGLQLGFANGWATSTDADTGTRDVTWQGRPIATEKHHRLTITEIE